MNLTSTANPGGFRDKVIWPWWATPEDERVALDCRMVAFDNRIHEEKWPIYLMVALTPLGKWSGRRRTDLRLVLSSPRDKAKLKGVGFSSKRRKPCWKSKSRNVRESMSERGS